MKYYAHSLLGKPQREWQLLEDQMQNATEMAREFVEQLAKRTWRHLAVLYPLGC